MDAIRRESTNGYKIERKTAGDEKRKRRRGGCASCSWAAERALTFINIDRNVLVEKCCAITTKASRAGENGTKTTDTPCDFAPDRSCIMSEFQRQRPPAGYRDARSTTTGTSRFGPFLSPSSHTHFLPPNQHVCLLLPTSSVPINCHPPPPPSSQL